MRCVLCYLKQYDRMRTQETEKKVAHIWNKQTLSDIITCPFQTMVYVTNVFTGVYILNPGYAEAEVPTLSH